MVLKNEDKLTLGQVSFLMYASAAGNIIYTFTFITSVTGRAFWIATFIGVLLNIPLVFWALYLGRQLQSGTIFDLLEEGLGKIITKLLIIIYFIINVAAASCMLSMFTQTVKVYFLQNTPSFIILLFLVFMCTVFVNSGLKNFARLIQILTVLYMANYFFGFFLSFFGFFKPEYVFPVFDSSILELAKGALITAEISTESLLCLMIILGAVPQDKKKYLSAAKGLITWSVLLSFAIFIMEGDIGHELLARVAQAGITVSRIIQIQNFIRGLEILLLMTYQYFAIVKTTIFLYSCEISSQKLFNVKNGKKSSKFFLILSAASIYAVSFYVDSFNGGYFYSIDLGCYVIFPFVILILILASVCTVIKKVKSRGVNYEN